MTAKSQYIRHDKHTRKDTQWLGCDLGERGTNSNC